MIWDDLENEDWNGEWKCKNLIWMIWDVNGDWKWSGMDDGNVT